MVFDDADADECHAARVAGGSRILLMGLSFIRYVPLFMSGLHHAGWEVGVLSPPPKNSTWSVGAPPLVRFARIVPDTGDRVDELIKAVSAWRPALVVPDYRASAKLMVSAARRLERASLRAPLRPDLRSTLSVMRCSLPRRREAWDVYNDKLKLMSALSSVDGVRTPWHQQIGDPHQVVAAGNATGAARLLALERRLPLVMKSDVDGDGWGITICYARSDLVRGLKAAARKGTTVMLEQFIDGVHAEFAATAVDGQLLAGFSYLDLVSRGPTGAALVMRAVNMPEMTRQVAAVVAALGYTGSLQLDFHVDRSGRAFLVDPNMRVTFIHMLPREVLGLDMSLFGALRAQIQLGAPRPPRRAATVQPIRRSVTLSYVSPGAYPTALSYCPDTFVHIPWEFGRFYEAWYEPGAARYDLRTCTVHFAGDPPDVVLRQRSPLCPGRSAPLSAVPAALDDHAPHVYADCARSLAWATERRACAPPGARVAHASALFVVEAQGGRRESALLLCGRPGMLEAPAGGLTVSSDSAVSERAAGPHAPEARWNLSLALKPIIYTPQSQ